MSVIAETVKVWRTSRGKRFLTKKAAVLREATDRIKLKDRHEPSHVIDELIGGEHHQDVSYTDDQWQHFRSIANRYWKIYGRRIAQ